MKAKVRPSTPPLPTQFTSSIEIREAPAQDDYLFEYLKSYEDLCARYRDVYNVHALKLRNRHNYVSVPLLVVTSATGVIASVQTFRTPGILVGAFSAILTAVQRYCAYAERAENARMTAKSHAKIIRKIENVKLVMKSDTVHATPEIFAKYIREIQTEIDSAQENASEVPWELLNVKK